MKPTDKEISHWLLATLNLFEVELAAQYKIAGMFLDALNAEAAAKADSTLAESE